MGSPKVSTLIMGLVRMLVQCDTQCSRILILKPSSKKSAQIDLNLITGLTAQATLAILSLFSLILENGTVLDFKITKPPFEKEFEESHDGGESIKIVPFYQRFYQKS